MRPASGRSRYPKTLSEKGLLKREGKTYSFVDLAGSRERQDTLCRCFPEEISVGRCKDTISSVSWLVDTNPVDLAGNP